MQRQEIKVGKLPKLVGNLYENKGKTLVILCHGFLASKDHPLITSLAKKLHKIVPVFAFDFFGYGDSEGKFEESTYSVQVHNVGHVLEYWRNRGFENFVLVGHSKGGAVVFRAASTFSDIDGIVGISGVVHGRRINKERFPPGIVKEVAKKGRIMVNEGKISYPLTNEYVLDALNHDSFVDVESLQVSKLFVHGSKDFTIKVEDARELFNRAHEPKTLEIIEGADHNYVEHLSELGEVVLSWVKSLIKKE